MDECRDFPGRGSRQQTRRLMPEVPCKRDVVGSIPTGGSTLHQGAQEIGGQTTARNIAVSGHVPAR